MTEEIRVTKHASADTLGVSGPTWPIRKELQELGGQWRPERKFWSLPVSKYDAVMRLIAERGAKPDPETVDPHAEVLLGRAKYKGRSYYVLAHGTNQQGEEFAKLCFRNGSRIFWVPKKNIGELEITKMYSTPKSIAALRAYSEQRRAEEAEESEKAAARDLFTGDDCAECGAPGLGEHEVKDRNGCVGRVCLSCSHMETSEREF